VSIEQWINENSEAVKKILAKKMLSKLSKAAVAVIFDEKCAECTEKSKMKDCYIPFLANADRIRTVLKLVLFGAIYNVLQPAGFAGLITAEVFASIATLHDEFIKWRLTNCNHERKIDVEKKDAYVA
jgi:hypothetical protein